MSRTRTFTALLALSRLSLGAGLLASPERVASGWIGEDARRAPVKMAIRAVGARDLAIAGGTLATLGERDALRLWIAAAIMADLGDVLATVTTPREKLPRNARLVTVALGGGSVVAGLALLADLSR